MNKIAIIAIIIALLIIIFWYIGVYNKLKRYLNKINEADSGIDVALAKRYNLITQMIEVVKGYSKHEKETLVEVVNLRDKMSIKEKIIASESMDRTISKINALIESYPELKASENFLTLQKALVNVEEHLSASRRMYNANVSLFNSEIEYFPSVIVAKNMRLKSKDFFKASNEEKDNISVNLE